MHFPCHGDGARQPSTTFASVPPTRRQLVRAVRVLAPVDDPRLRGVRRVRSLESEITGRSGPVGDAAAVGPSARGRAARRAERDPGAVGRARALGGPAGVRRGADRARKVDAPVEVRCNAMVVRFGLARLTAQQIEEASLFYGCRARAWCCGCRSSSPRRSGALQQRAHPASAESSCGCPRPA